MRLRVVSDGTVNGYAVVDADSGAVVEGVESIKFEQEQHRAPVLVIRVARAACDVRGEVDRLTD